MLAYTVISLVLASLAFSAPVSTPRPILTAANITNATQTSLGSWYFQNGRAGACGNFSTDADFVVGLPLEFYNVTSQVSDLCGSYIIVTNPLSNLTVAAKVADASGANMSMSLSVATYKALVGEKENFNFVHWIFANSTQLESIYAAESNSSSQQFLAPVTAASLMSSTKVATPSSTYEAPSATSTYIAPSSTSVYVAPQPTYVAPTSTYVAPTSTYVAPKPTYAAPTPTYVAPAPVKAVAPSSGQFSGKATYYNQEGGTGACGKVFPDSAYIVAIQAGMYDGAKCGDSLTITRPSNGKTITAIMADKCPGCPSRESIDLSVGAFSALAELGEGVIDIVWSWNQ